MRSYLLLIYLFVYLGTAFVLPSCGVWKKTVVNPVTFDKAETAHDYIGKLFKVTIVGLTPVIILNAVVPEIRPFLLPVFWLENNNHSIHRYRFTSSVPRLDCSRVNSDGHFLAHRDR